MPATAPRRRPPGRRALLLLTFALAALTLLAGAALLAQARAAVGSRPPAAMGRGAPQARTPPPPAPSSVAPIPAVRGPKWVLPLAGAPDLRRGFEAPTTAWGPGHRGVDLAAAPGAAVLATADGVVSWAGMVAGRGVVTVTHAGGVHSTYEPVTGAPPVGSTVRAGEAIGVLGSQGGHCGARTCLHWGVLRGRDYLDPMSLLARGRAVLLPFWPTAPTGPGRTR